MASLLGETLFEIGGQGPAPIKDYFYFEITRSEVIWRCWKISLRSDCRNTKPGELRESHEDYIEDGRLQSQVAMVFGPHILEYSKNLCQGRYDYIVRLPNSLLFNIMAHLNLEDISGLSRTCQRFRELCNTEEFWEQTVRNHWGALTPSVEALAKDVGWRTVFFTNKLQLQMQISRRKQKENQPCEDSEEQSCPSVPLEEGYSSSSLIEDTKLLDTGKAFAHLGAFIVTCLFTCLIIVIVRDAPELRENPRYILLCLHCVCVSGFNIMGAVVHGLRSLRWPVSRIVCWILFDVQVVMARGLMISLTLMSVSTCVSICLPLRYTALVQRYRHWVMLASCAFALFNPIVFTVLACVRYPWDYVIGLDTECSTALEGTACIVSALTQLSLLILLIIGSYVVIYMEGRRAGHFTPSNSKGRRTILIHCLQMTLHILPSLIIISRHQERLAVALALFIVFCSAQSLSPVVFGLRCKELSMEMPQFLSCLQGSCGHIGSTDNTSIGTVTSAGTGASIETDASACMATGTLSAVISECEREQKEMPDITELNV